MRYFLSLITLIALNIGMTALAQEAKKGIIVDKVALDSPMLTAHSVGSGVWGDSNGDFDLETLNGIFWNDDPNHTAAMTKVRYIIQDKLTGKRCMTVPTLEKLDLGMGVEYKTIGGCYPQGTGQEVKQNIGGRVDADYITNTCAIR